MIQENPSVPYPLSSVTSNDNLLSIYNNTFSSSLFFLPMSCPNQSKTDFLFYSSPVTEEVVW